MIRALERFLAQCLYSALSVLKSSPQAFSLVLVLLVTTSCRSFLSGLGHYDFPLEGSYFQRWRTSFLWGRTHPSLGPCGSRAAERIAQIVQIQGEKIVARHWDAVMGLRLTGPFPLCGSGDAAVRLAIG